MICIRITANTKKNCQKSMIKMKKYKVGFTMGVFDLFHVGHLNLPERCKELCDYLIVAVCGDDYVTQVKKKHRFLLKKNA